jgi:hypothetical protein
VILSESTLRCTYLPEQIIMNQEDIVYRFTLETGEIKKIQLCFDQDTLTILSPNPTDNLPDWTRLECHQCSICPKRVDECPYCPIAVNISTLADSFNDFPSYYKSEVCVETQSRTFVKTTDVQTALSSILGIYMATSGCPIMDKLRPMVRFHLPFATPLETQYRAISMYLTAQYLRYKKGKVPDWSLKGFVKMYEDVQKVNVAFCKRLNEIDHCETNMSALIILDDFASLINLNFQIDEQLPSELEPMFRPFLHEP